MTLQTMYPRSRSLAHRAMAAIVVLAMATFAVGCSIANDTSIPIDYTPTSFFSPVQGADGVTVRIEVADMRPDKAKVGEIQTGDGGVQPITTPTNVAEVVKQALASGLETRGFNLSSTGAVLLRVDISNFTSDVQGGTIASSASAQISMNVRVVAANGKATYSQTASASGTGASAKTALDRALSDAINNLLTDSRFTRALVIASHAH